jgi:large subunit ribosomal protein L24
MKIKKNDKVIIIAGKDRGKVAKVLRALPSEGKILVEGVNMKKRRERPRKQGQKGQTIEKPLPIDASNALYFCATCNKGVRIGSSENKDKKLRVCKKCGKEI